MDYQNDGTQGPIILWLNYGTEGWHPYSYPSVRAALEETKNYDYIITRQVAYEIKESP